MRVDGNTVHKCIHEALDSPWCDCPDEIRADLQVKLPRPIQCESCDNPAQFFLTISESTSAANGAFLCRACSSWTLNDWMTHIDDEDEAIDGWEITRL